MKKLIKAKGSLFFFSSGLVVVNFLTTLIIARALGFGLNLDVYYISLSIYLFLLSSIGWSLTGIITPILLSKGGDEIISQVFYIVTTWAIAIVMCIALLIPFLTDFIYSNYITTFSTDILHILFGMSCLIFIIDVVAQVFICFENSNERFSRAVQVNFFASLIGLLCSSTLVDVYSVIGALSTQLLIKTFLLLFLLFLNFDALNRYHYDKHLAKKLFNKAKYFFISGLYYRTEDLTEKYIASFLAPGLLSLVSFVQRIYGAVITVINTVIITPTLTRFCKNNNTDTKYLDHNFMRLITIAIVISSLLLFPVFYFFGEKFLLLIFSNKLLLVKDNITLTLTMLFPMFAFLTINQLLHNFLLSRSKEKNIAVYDMISYSISLLIKVGFTVKFGFIGFLIGVLCTSIIKLMFKYYLVFGVIKNERKFN